MEYCPHCMQPTTGTVCTHCGGEVRWTAPATQLPLGTLLRGPSGRVYQVGAAKGQGGFGITYAAMDLMNNQRVAIKEYYPTRCATRDHMNNVLSATGQLENFQGGKRSFLEEAHMLSAVGALPSVVSVRDFFEANGTAYLVMEYVEGMPLHEVVARQGRMSEEQLLPMLPTLLRDLDILHRAGVIHRDISPDNLILTPQGTLKLLDFGSARSVQDGKSMTVMLKAGFSPVEQYQSKGQGPYTDVYALAGTIYYCLTGKLPPTAIDRITEDTIQRPNANGARLPHQQEEALLWGLTVQPKMRPQSMSAFANAMFPQNPGASVAESVNTAAAGQGEIPLGYDLTTGQRTGNTHTGDTHTGNTHTGNTHTGNTHTGNTGTGGRKSMSKGLLFGIIGGAVAAVAVVAILLMTLLSGGTTDDGFKYRVRGGDAYITGYEGSGSDLTVPSFVEDNMVVGIRSGAFEDLKSIKTITVPDTVATVEADAFAGCTNLELVTFENKSIALEGDVFSGCDKLRCIVLPNEKSCDRVADSDALKQLDNVATCYIGQKLGSGVIQSVMVSDGMAFGLMDNRTAVVLLVPSGVKEDNMPAMVGGLRVFTSDGRRVGAEVGTTEDGYQYELLGGTAILVGYTGTDVVLIMPEDINGTEITEIAAGAFAGNTDIEAVFFPDALTTIGAGAFENCTGLTDLYVYGNVQAASTAFSGCTRLRVVVTVDCSVASWTLPAGCLRYDSNEDTGAGSMRYALVDEQGIVYAITSESVAVILDIPAGLSQVTIPDTMYDYEVSWTHKNALKNAKSGIVINMAPTLGFPYELWKADVTWVSGVLGTFSYNWVYSCMLCDQINNNRAPGQPKIAPDKLVVEAAMVRAKELSSSNSHTRPSGKEWSTVLDDKGVNWDSARTFKKAIYSSSFSTDFDAHIAEIPENFTEPNDSGKNFVLFGWAAYRKSSSSTVYCNTIGVVLP